MNLFLLLDFSPAMGLKHCDFCGMDAGFCYVTLMLGIVLECGYVMWKQFDPFKVCF